MKVIVENSTWNNVGDAFYQFPLYEILKSILKEDDVFMFDGPINRAFRPNNFFEKNCFEIRSILDADVYVFSGPILGEIFIDSYGEIIKSIKKNKKNFMILSSYGSSEQKNKNIEFLTEYSPLAFSSRTDRTFENYSKISKNSYNGICNAFFISKTIPTINLNFNNYLISSFYSMPEPIIDFDLKENKIELDTIKVKKRRNYLARASRHFDFLRKYPSHIKNKKIIRTVHDIAYKFSHLNFGRKNSYLSYNPLNYLPLYKNCELTISDRIHACVTALSFNNPAMLIGDWGERAELLNKFDLQKTNNVLLPNLSKQIDREYENYITWLKKVFSYLK